MVARPSPSMLPHVDRFHILNCVDLCRRLVLPYANNPWKAQCVPAVVPVGAHDGIECHFQHNLGLNVAREAGGLPSCATETTPSSWRFQCPLIP